MWEQYRAREWNWNNKSEFKSEWTEEKKTASTAAWGGDINNGYLNEGDLMAFVHGNGSPVTADAKGIFNPPYSSAKDVIKPFVSGMPTPNPTGTAVNADKRAGVDSIGILVGSLAIAVYPTLNEKILDVANNCPAISMDAYITKTPNMAGLDGKGLPIFYSTPGSGTSSLSGGYRFTRSDIERCTVLVPDIADIQLGDLLLRDNTEDGLQLGVVVAVPSTQPEVGKDGTSFMSQVMVLSTDRNHGGAYLSAWAGGTFASNPKSCQIRRLLELNPAEYQLTPYANDNWELVDTSHSWLSVKIACPDFAPGVQSHWIPNTGEMLLFKSITIKKLTPWDSFESFSSEKPVITLLGLKDYGFGPGDTDNSNIYMNRSDSRIEFCAVKGNESRAIAIFTRQDGSDEYKVTLVDGNTLTVDGDSLSVSGNGWNKIKDFGLRIKKEDVASARPGDDFLLRFAEVDKSNPKDIANPIAVGTVSDSSFLSVYDKKLLWRANLYIDEGENDWNKLNPWNGPDNEWNTPQAGYTGVLGGQVVKFPEWTRFYDSTHNVFFNLTEGPISEAAPYTSGSTDSPYAVIEKLQNQQAVLNFYKINGLGGFTKDATGWTKTTTPSGHWYDYIERSTSNASPSWTLASGAPQVLVNGVQKYPYRPNLSAMALYGKFLAADGNAVYFQAVNRFVRESIGVDCSGFLQRAASYNSNLYKLNNVTRDVTWADSTENNQTIGLLEGTGGIATDSWLAWNDNELFDPSDPDALRTERIPVMVVPGDIVLMYNGNTIPHVAIVYQASDTNGDGKITREEVFFIEAASGHNARYRVMNDQSWWSYRNATYAQTWRFELKRLTQ
jgi:hypothetical protein